MSQEIPTKNSLFEPSLVAAPPARPLYSIGSNFIVAFLGGVYAAAAYAGLNARRMNRLDDHLWFIAVPVVIWTAALIWLGRAIALDEIPTWLRRETGFPAAIRVSGRAAGLLLLAFHYLRHKHFYRAQTVAGIASPSPWVPGIAALVVSAILNVGMVAIGGIFAR